MGPQLVARIAVLLASVLLVANVQPQEKFVAGKNYSAISPAQRTSSPPDKIEIAVVFMYGCVHCADLRPELKRWMGTWPSDVKVVDLPASFYEVAFLHAKAYYAAEALNVVAKTHDDMFNAIHVEKRPLSTKEELRDFFTAEGVDAAAFDALLESKEIDRKARGTAELTMAYGVRVTPSIVVNGKYLTTLQQAGTYDAWLEILNELIARERSELGKSAPSR